MGPRRKRILHRGLRLDTKARLGWRLAVALVSFVVQGVRVISSMVRCGYVLCVWRYAGVSGVYRYEQQYVLSGVPLLMVLRLFVLFLLLVLNKSLSGWVSASHSLCFEMPEWSSLEY